MINKTCYMTLNDTKLYKRGRRTQLSLPLFLGFIPHPLHTHSRSHTNAISKSRAATSLLPIIIETSPVKTHDSANEYEERCEFYEHSTGLDHMCMP